MTADALIGLMRKCARHGTPTLAVRPELAGVLAAEFGRLRADLAAKDALIVAQAGRIAAASEVLSRAAEQGRACPVCVAKLVGGGDER